MTVTIDATIDAPLERVWAVISDFANLQQWHPLVQRCETEGEGVGSIRVVHFADSWASERLERLDADSHTLHYAIIDGSNPAATGLTGAIALGERGNGSTSLRWVSGLDPDRPEAEALDRYLESYYPQRIEHLRSALRSAG